MSTINKLRSALLITLAMLISGTYAYADEPASEKVKEIAQTYPVSNNDQINVENSFGSIVVSYWNKSEVSIRVIIEAQGRNDNRANELLDKVNIEIKKSGNRISAITTLKKFSTSNNERISINYIINMPSTMQNKLVQKYGDIVISDKNNSETFLDISYGNIKAGDFTKNLAIEGKYGNIIIGNLENARMNISYCGKVELKDGNDIYIDSKYSQIQARDINNLRLECSYGGLQVDEVADAKMDIKYSNATIESVTKSLVSDALSFSTLNVNKLSPDFDKFYTSGNYGNVNIRISSKAAFQVEAQNMRYGNVDIEGFKADTSKENSSIRSTVNGGSRKQIIRMEGGNYNNLRIKSL